MWRREVIIYPSRSGSKKYDYFHSSGSIPCEYEQFSNHSSSSLYRHTKVRLCPGHEDSSDEHDFFPCSSHTVVIAKLPRSHRTTETYHSYDRGIPIRSCIKTYGPIYRNDIDDVGFPSNLTDPDFPWDHEPEPLYEPPAAAAAARMRYDSSYKKKPKRPSSRTNQHFRSLSNEAQDQKHTNHSRRTPSQTNQYFRNLYDEAQEQKRAKLQQQQQQQPHVSQEPLMSGARNPRDPLTDRERQNAGLVKDRSGNWLLEDGHRDRGRQRHRRLGGVYDDVPSFGERDWHWHWQKCPHGFVEELED